MNRVITKERVEQLYEDLLEQARSYYAHHEREQEHPMLMLHFRWCEVHQEMEQGPVIPLEVIAALGGKQAVASYIEAAHRECDVDDVLVMIDEAWMKVIEVPEGKGADATLDAWKAQNKRVKDAPGSVEVLVMRFFGQGVQYFASHPIDRTTNPVTLKEGKLEAPKEISGAMVSDGGHDGEGNGGNGEDNTPKPTVH